MKQLVVTLGVSGSGKSTWVKQNQLQAYTIGPDDFILQYGSPRLQEDGSYGVDQTANKVVWAHLFEVLDFRMKNGELTVIDATNLEIKNWRRYKQMCRQYGYELIVASFIDVSIDDTKFKNRQRKGSWSHVSDEVIEKQYSKLQNVVDFVNDIADYHVNKLDLKSTLADNLWQDLSHYKKVHHIGDIHGSYDALITYLGGGKIKDEEAYIFVGDYTDRGTQNVEVVKFLTSLRNKPNVFFLEGNHDTRLARFSKGREVSSHEQFNKTKSELAHAVRNEEIDPAYVKDWTRTFKDGLFYEYLGKKVYVTHGGLNTEPNFLSGIASRDLINGVGNREFDVDNAFQDYVDRTGQENLIQVHGHRNRFKLPANFYDNSINLEGQVEFGGELRAFTLERTEDNEVIQAEHHIPNRNFHPFYNDVEDTFYNDDVNRMEKLMLESDQGVDWGKTLDGTVYTIDQENDLPDDLKGMRSVVVKDNYICHRAYDSVYGVGESDETKLVNLAENLAFPVIGYNKYDGFLIEISFKKDDNGDPMMAIGADDEENKFEDIKYMFSDRFNDKQMVALYEFATKHNATLHFEIVSDERLDSIIHYGKPETEIILLDAVIHEVRQKTVGDMTVHEFVGEFNDLGKKHILYKQLAITNVDWAGFLRTYRTIKSNVYDFKGEGFVFEDARGFRFTVDTNWYTMLSGYKRGMQYLGTPLVFDESWFNDVNISTLEELKEAYKGLLDYETQNN